MVVLIINPKLLKKLVAGAFTVSEILSDNKNTLFGKLTIMQQDTNLTLFSVFINRLHLAKALFHDTIKVALHLRISKLKMKSCACDNSPMTHIKYFTL